MHAKHADNSEPNDLSGHMIEFATVPPKAHDKDILVGEDFDWQARASGSNALPMAYGPRRVSLRVLHASPSCICANTTSH
jgi:hypothetical protein